MSYAQDADRIIFQNEVKKALYKQKPLAHIVNQTNHIWSYQCDVIVGGRAFTCNFSVRVDEMGEATFIRDMSAQLLIRWLDI